MNRSSVVIVSFARDDSDDSFIYLVTEEKIICNHRMQLKLMLMNIWKEAHKQGEKRLTRLEGMVGELVEAQNRTDKKVEELAEAHKQGEKRLTRLEEMVGKLVEAQTRTDKKMEELAEAQKQTAAGLQTLVREHKKTRQQLGGLSMTVGYTLENEAYKALPDLLQRDHKISVQGRLIRCYVQDRYDDSLEVNIFGQGKRGDTTVTILGESKSQLSRNKIDAFLNKRLERFKGVFEEIVPVLVTHMTSSPDVEGYAKDQGIVLYYSYDF